MKKICVALLLVALYGLISCSSFSPVIAKIPSDWTAPTDMGRIRTDGFYSYRWRSEYPDTLLVLYADGSAWCDGYAFRYDVVGDTLRLSSLVKKRKGPVKEEYIITPDSVLNFLYRKRPDISRDAKFIKGQTPPSPFQMPEKYWKSRMAIDFNLADIFPFCSLSQKNIIPNATLQTCSARMVFMNVNFMLKATMP